MTVYYCATHLKSYFSNTFLKEKINVGGGGGHYSKSI